MEFISFCVSVFYVVCLSFLSLAVKKEYDGFDWEIRERINKISWKISPQTLFLIFFALIIVVAGWRNFRLESILLSKVFGILILMSEFMHYRKKMMQAKLPSGYINCVVKFQVLMILCFAALQAFQAFLRVRSN